MSTYCSLHFFTTSQGQCLLVSAHSQQLALTAYCTYCISLWVIWVIVCLLVTVHLLLLALTAYYPLPWVTAAVVLGHDVIHNLTAWHEAN